MNETRLCSLEQLQAFLGATAQVQFLPCEGEDARYAHIEAVLKRFGYRGRLGRKEKGLVRRYLVRTTGYSRQQVTRLVRQFRERGALAKRYRPPAHGFARTYTAADVAVLAETDALHNGLSGLATGHLMQRALVVFGDTRYTRLASISVAHLYNLRARAGYRARRQHWTKTRPVQVPIGQRRAPQPHGRPGFLRIDSVHQGEQDGLKGLYHINAVDCVTQWEVVATCEKLSEAYLLPVIEVLLAAFPFAILGLHADNGYFFSADTIEELARKIEKGHEFQRVPLTNLAETVRKWNSYVDAGADPDFARGKDAPMHKIDKPPFYAASICPVWHDSYGGLRINGKGQVIDTQGEVIPGLYSGGEASGGGNQHGLGRALVHGYIAGVQIARERA